MSEPTREKPPGVDLIKNAKTAEEHLQILHEAGLLPGPEGGVESLTEEGLQRWANIKWAENDPEVRATRIRVNSSFPISGRS